ncbi:MAG TPA: MgtC/SapB family protein [Terriglobales bacterium]|nr:MgtC/SapB family protein [Terriglobales bacterium]
MDLLKQLWEHYGPQTELAYFTAQTMLRLVLAAFLGGAIGLEREIHRKPAGLRTNMFICFGSAMFTILSYKLAGEFTGDHTRIAAQIIPGIGFIGAGSILHARGNVSGLTTAATIFVVASIGMACGGGLYIPAIFATVVLVLALSVLGLLEKRFNLKDVTMIYEMRGQLADEIIAAVNGVLEDDRKIMESVQIGRSNGHFRVQFTIHGTYQEHQSILKKLKVVPQAESVECLGITDHE